MKHGSLFSGIGGFDLAAEWMGWENVFHCEINPFCQKVLKYYWPNAKSYTDIKATDFSIWRGRIDILTGGFPCQPYSVAGKRKGKEDDRHLWPEMLRAIREIQPAWIVPENVHGIVNWSRGLVFDEVQTEMEAEGYEIMPLLLPACSVNAIHKRYRTWFVAHSNKSNDSRTARKNEDKSKSKKIQKWDEMEQPFEPVGLRVCPNSNSERFQRLNGYSGYESESLQKPDEAFPSRFIAKGFDDLPQPYVIGKNDGLPVELDGITFSSWLDESIEGFGNAIVPQVVYQIFKAIEQYEN